MPVWASGPTKMGGLPSVIFMSAFPSVAHTRIMLVLHAMDLPVGFVNVIRALYNPSRIVCPHTSRALMYVLAGVLQ